MKHLTTYIRESEQITELFHLGTVLKYIKRLFMPWTDEAMNFYKNSARKIFLETLTESAGSPQEVWSDTRDGVNIVLYNYRSAKSKAQNVLNAILNYKDHPNIFKFADKPTPDNTGYVINIYISDHESGLWGIFMPGQNGNLSCLINYIKPSKDASQITKLIKTDLKKIMDTCLSKMKSA